MLSLMLVMTLLICAFSVTAFATGRSNHYDSNFTFSFVNGEHEQTSYRTKTDDTNVYMKVNFCRNEFTAHVVGANDLDAPYGHDCSRGYTYTVSEPGEYRMRNWVYDGAVRYKYAAIYAAPTYGFEYTASGVWSPDSI